jgi:hypothetical protein
MRILLNPKGPLRERGFALRPIIIWVLGFVIIMIGTFAWKIFISNRLNGSGLSDSKSSTKSSWTRTVDKDAFTDKASIVYLLKQEGKSSRDDMLGLSCSKEKKLDFAWLVSAKSPMPMGQEFPISVSSRLDEGNTSDSEWLWSSINPKISPRDVAKFLDTLIGKKRLALRENQTGSTAVFDIGGIDSAYAEVKSACVK